MNDVDEYTIILVVIGIGLLIIAGKLSYDRWKWKKKLAFQIEQSWGKQPMQEYSLEEFECISHFYRNRSGGNRGIDDITWNDLGMDEVYMLLNHTWSSPGQEYLYDLLRNPEYREEPLRERERLIQYFTDHGPERRKLEMAFAKMGRVRSISMADYIYNLTDLKEEKNLPHILMALAALAAIGFIFVNPGAGVMTCIVVMGFNIGQYFKVKKQVEPYITSFHYIIRMLNMAKELEKIQLPELAEYQQQIRKTAAQFAKFKRNSFWVLSGQGSVGGDPMNLVLDYIRMVFHVDIIRFQSMLKEIKRRIPDVEKLMEQVGILDSMIAVASFRQMMPFTCVPKFELHSALDAENVYHPLVEHAVASTIHAERGVLVTGSNASGKSTFLKTIAINALLAQSIHTVLADSYRADFFELYSSMALKDNLQGQESYYIVEIKSLKRILDAAARREHPVLCFVDEVLRGTNTVERIAASSEVLKSLADEGVVCFAATHDIELTYILEAYYDNYHFQEEIKDQDILFDYRLYEGRAVSRNAIKLLGLIGYEKDIIEKAEAMAARFQAEGVWKL